MGKLLDRLQYQLTIPEQKENAEECIIVYNWLKGNDLRGIVWSSHWNPLVTTKFKGFPSDERYYSLNFIGKTLLKGIKS